MDAKLRQFLAKVKKEHDDDAVDRTIYATTVYMLGFFAVCFYVVRLEASFPNCSGADHGQAVRGR